MTEEREIPNGLPVMRVPVRARSPYYAVEVDRDLELRGQTFPAEKRIVLRQWDEECFLHECIHAAIAEGQMTKPGFTNSAEAVVSVAEEDLVSHLSHALFGMGWRFVWPEQETEGCRRIEVCVSAAGCPYRPDHV